MGGQQPPEFLSDHPSHEARIVALRKWLPEAELRLEQSDCNRTVDFLRAFGRSWGTDDGRGMVHGPVVGFDGRALGTDRLVSTEEAVKDAYDQFGGKKGPR